MTYKPSTANHGEALLTWCQEASRARTSAQPERAQESKERDQVCGSTWRESSARFDLASSSWKTHQCLWEEDLEWSSVTLPKWGMMRSGVLWERITPPLLTNETESGSWRTPMATDGTKTSNRWRDGRTNSLNAQVAMYPTPRACMTGAATPERLNDKNRNLEKAVAQVMWPTPCATDHKGSGKTGTLRDRLDYAVERGATKSKTFATPQARDFRSPSDNRWGNPNRTQNLNDQVGGMLNPTWVEWLMGWPIGWTDCAASATDKYQQWCLSHGTCLPKFDTHGMTTRHAVRSPAS